jgi:hypothetical protein
MMRLAAQTGIMWTDGETLVDRARSRRPQEVV